MSNKYPELDLMFAIPNEGYGGGKQNLRRGMYFKAEGRKAGVPDVFLPVPKGKYHGLFIEMKKPRYLKPKISKKQKFWLEALSKQGYKTAVCYGFHEARELILNYLEGEV